MNAFSARRLGDCAARAWLGAALLAATSAMTLATGASVAWATSSAGPITPGAGSARAPTSLALAPKKPSARTAPPKATPSAPGAEKKTRTAVPALKTSAQRKRTAASAARAQAATATASPKSAVDAPRGHALGDWDEGAKDPKHFIALRRARGWDPGEWRVYLGASIGSTVFSHELDLGAGNYGLRLTPHGAASYGARLGIDFGRWVSFVSRATYTSTTFFEGGDFADISTATAGLAARYGGFFDPRWEVFLEIAGGVMALMSDTNFIGRDVDGLLRVTTGTRFVGAWLIPRLDVSALVADGFAVGSNSASWQITASFAVPVLAW